MGKFKITLFVLMCFLTLSVSARHAMRHMTYDGMLRKGWHMGVSGSVNSTWILNQNNYNTLDLFSIPIVRESEMDYVFTWGGQVGVELGYNFTKNFGIEFEPSFSWAGQSYDDAFTGPVAAVYDNATNTYVPDGNPNHLQYYSGTYAYVPVHRDIRFTYFQLPIYARYQTHIGDIANYYLMLGPQLNIRQTASEEVYVNNHRYIDSTNNFTADEKFKKIDAGLSINSGVDIYAKDNVYFSVGLVSYIGLTDLNGDVLKTLGWYSKNDVSYQSSHNFYIGIHAGIHFFTKRQLYY